MTKPFVPADPADSLEPEKRPAYMPCIHWGFLGVAAALVGLVVLLATVQQQRRADAVRQRILHLRDHDLRDVATVHRHFRVRLNSIIDRALNSGASDHVRKGFSMAKLHSEPGLYLRLSERAARSGAPLAPTSRSDALARCLGLSPMAVREQVDKGEILMPEYLASVHDTNEVLRLRVIEDQLLRRVQLDLGTLNKLADARWLMLVLERADGRHQDVSIWDLEGGHLLAQTSVVPRGRFITAYYRVDGEPKTARRLPDSDSMVAADCSLAAHVRELLKPPA